MENFIFSQYDQIPLLLEEIYKLYKSMIEILQKTPINTNNYKDISQLLKELFGQVVSITSKEVTYASWVTPLLNFKKVIELCDYFKFSENELKKIQEELNEVLTFYLDLWQISKEKLGISN